MKKLKSLIFVMMLLALSLTLIPSSQAAAFEADTYIDFNGSTQYATAGNSTALRTFNAITIELWIQPQATCQGQFVAKAEDYSVWCDVGNIGYSLGSSTTAMTGVATTIELRTNEWHHVAISRAASTATTYLYLDGQLIYTGTADDAGTGAIRSTTTTFLNIGRLSPTAGSFFNGLIDEVRIFNIARTGAEIASDMHTWGNLGLSSVVGYYDFNSMSGTTITNKATSPDANSNLTTTGSPTSGRIDSSVTTGDQTVVTFNRSYLNSNGGWFPSASVSRYRALVVAGGGGGGNDEGGGGGGGGFIDSAMVQVTPDIPLAIKIGQGGIGSNGVVVTAYGNDGTIGNNGQNSIFASLTSVGGGAGGTSTNTDNDPVRTGVAGGSGGGGAGETALGHAGGSGTSGQGFAGGAGAVSGSNVGGGGGGASEAGNTNGVGQGGDGLASDISGTSTTYAGGGGGGNGNGAASVYLGGAGGGGRGGASASINYPGTANTGGGGGGGCGALSCGSNGQNFSGASGGSGIVILRYVTTGSAVLSGFSFSTPPMKSTNTTITLVMSTPGKMQFTIGNTRIKNCISRVASGSGSTYTVTCIWKPAVQGPQLLKIGVTPTSALYPPMIYQSQVTVVKRTGNR